VKKKLEHNHLIDGKYLKEDCIENLAVRLAELVPTCLMGKLQEALVDFEDDCVAHDVHRYYCEKGEQ